MRCRCKVGLVAVTITAYSPGTWRAGRVAANTPALWGASTRVVVSFCGVLTSARTVNCPTCWASRMGCPWSWRKARMLIGSPTSWYGGLSSTCRLRVLEPMIATPSCTPSGRSICQVPGSGWVIWTRSYDGVEFQVIPGGTLSACATSRCGVTRPMRSCGSRLAKTSETSLIVSSIKKFP